MRRWLKRRLCALRGHAGGTCVAYTAGCGGTWDCRRCGAVLLRPGMPAPERHDRAAEAEWRDAVAARSAVERLPFEDARFGDLR